MSVPCILSTEDTDRVGDIVKAQGCRLEQYQLNPVVLYSHGELPFPIARGCPSPGAPPAIQLDLHRPVPRVLGRAWFLQKGRWAETALDVFHMICEGVLTGVSIGFDPDPSQTRMLRDGGHEYGLWDLLEFSFTPLPANAYAGVIRRYLERGRIAGKRIHPLLRKSLAPLAEAKKVWANGGIVRKDLAARPTERHFVPTLKAWPATTVPVDEGDFDPRSAPLEPARTEYDWAAKYLDVPIKQLYLTGTSVPRVRMGSFLRGLEYALQGYERREVRNLHGSAEAPPRYETIELNSKSRDSFLMEGLAFYQGQRRLILGFDEDYGLNVRLYARFQDRQAGQKVLDDAWQWAIANNLLKGEAFTLNGQFLERTAEGWGDVFLEEANKKSLERTVSLYAQKGDQFAPRGVILTGPPGTGKTLSVRIIRNTAPGTFIWLSSRDFYSRGAFGGIAQGFSLARELAPAVLCLEDVDHWLDEHTVDLLKTEMDGLVRTKGVLTLVTTNFPERLPEALLDRPGRFHDVLRFGLPGDTERQAMLRHWLPDFPPASLTEAVAGTDGMAGAHVYELAHFARTLTEHDGMEPAQAVSQALAKVAEQRELISDLQRTGGRLPRFRSLTKCQQGENAGKPGVCPGQHGATPESEGGKPAPRGKWEDKKPAASKSPGHGERANALAKKRAELLRQMEELKKERQSTYNAIKEEAQSALERAHAQTEVMDDHYANIAWPSEDDDPENGALFTELEEYIRGLPGGPEDEELVPGALDERLGAIISLAQDMQATRFPEGYLSPEEDAENKKRLAGIAASAKKARQELRVYARHRRELGAIRRGETIGEEGASQKQHGRWQKK